MSTTRASLALHLQQARQAQRWSQLALSLHLGVSQKHISFVETGRARPSRPLLLRWLEALSLPMSTRNALLQLAGFAPMFSASALHDPHLEQARTALSHLLQSHDPQPALVIGAHWDVLQINRGAQWLAETLMPELLASPHAKPNLLDWMLHPQGLMKNVINKQEAVADFWAQLRRDQVDQPQLAPQIDAFVQKFSPLLQAGAIAQAPSVLRPLLNLRFMTAYGELAFFRVFSTFGSPHDITLASMRVEHMFPADPHTRAVMEKNVARTASLVA